MEAGLDVRAGAVDDVGGDLVAVEVQVTGRVRVGVGRVEGRRTGADGAVHAEVAGRARAAELDGLVHGAELAPVADHLRQRQVGRQ